MSAVALAALRLASLHTAADQAELLDMVNRFRSAHGVEALTLQPELCRVAEGHAGFMFQNNVLSHFEKPDMKGFTGCDLAERAGKVGWDDDLSELVGYANTGLDSAVRAIFDSPCHRVRFLKPGKLTLGASAQGDYVCLLVGGEAAPQTVVSPPDGATGVPTEWHGATDFSGTRTGVGSRLFGYPIVFIVASRSTAPLTSVRCELSDGLGSPVPFALRSHDNDDHFDDALAVIPERPLQSQSRYSVHVVAKKSNGQVEEKRWTFQTR